MTKFLTAVLSVIAVGVLLIAYGLLAPRAAAAPIDNGGGIWRGPHLRPAISRRRASIEAGTGRRRHSSSADRRLPARASAARSAARPARWRARPSAAASARCGKLCIGKASSLLDPSATLVTICVADGC